MISSVSLHYGAEFFLCFNYPSSMSFVDRTHIHVTAGDGGNGCVSFRREKYVARGGPDGGDGGRGGDVILRASAGVRTLAEYGRKHHFKAAPGGHGSGADKHGKSGADCILEVPVGTTVYAKNDEARVLADLVSDGQYYVAAKGGRGGSGNRQYAGGARRAPKFAGKGKAGEQRWLTIELKLIADIGLIGMPNGGKSSLLAALTAATPKVADYSFTTLAPQLGVLQHGFMEPLILADIPGLIKGAHAGKGLGHHFLRHVERTSILVHVVDCALGDFERNYHAINEELSIYDRSLIGRVKIVVLNKIDLLDDRQRAEVYEKAGHFAAGVVGVSARTGEGIDTLRGTLIEAASESSDDRSGV
jgi:GTP-binding protein